MAKIRLKQIAQEGATNGQAIVWNNTNGVWEAGTVSGGGIATDVLANRPTADGTQGFFYATDTQGLWYDDSSTWEEVGIVADGTTIEVNGSGQVAIVAGGVNTTQLAGGAVTIAKIDAKTDANPGLLGYGTSGTPAEIEEGTAGQVLTSAGTGGAPSFQDKDVHVRSLTMESPTDAEDFSFFWTRVAITATRVAYAVRGATPSITGTIRSGTTRSGTGTVVHTITGGTSTTGTDAAPSGTAAIGAGSYVWFESTAVGAATDELFIALEYTED